MQHNYFLNDNIVDEKWVKLLSDNKKLPQNRIAELRKRKKLSQAQLAKETGLTRQAISLYEIGKREPKLETWVKLANFFNVPVSYLNGYENISFYNMRMDTFKDISKGKKNSFVMGNLTPKEKDDLGGLVYSFASVLAPYIQKIPNDILNDDSIKKEISNYNKIRNNILNEITALILYLGEWNTEYSEANKEKKLKDKIQMENKLMQKNEEILKKINNLASKNGTISINKYYK